MMSCSCGVTLYGNPSDVISGMCDMSAQAHTFPKYFQKTYVVNMAGVHTRQANLT